MPLLFLSVMVILTDGEFPVTSAMVCVKVQSPSIVVRAIFTDVADELTTVAGSQLKLSVSP